MTAVTDAPVSTSWFYLCAMMLHFRLLGFFIFKASGLQKGSGGGLSDVAPWKGHLAWRALPDSGPYTGATGTW